MRRYLPLLLALLVIPAPALAAPHPLATATTRREGNTLYVQVKVNQAGPFWFAVDTGAHHTILDPFVVQQAKLTVTTSSTTSGTGKGEVAYQHAGPVSVSIGPLKLDIADPWVIDLSSVPIAKDTHGLVGAQFFEAWVIEFDPEKPALRFFDPATYQPSPGATKIPLTVENDRLYVTATLDVNDQLTVDHKLRVDTGSEDSVADDVVTQGLEVRSSSLGNGLGASYQGQSGVFKAVHLGPFTFTHVWGPAAPLHAIGMEIFRRFTCIFDAPHRLLYLIPNRHLAEPIPPPPA